MKTHNKRTNAFAILGFIFSFIMPLIGFILSIIALHQISKYKEKGWVLAVCGLIISLSWAILIILLIIFTFITVLI